MLNFIKSYSNTLTDNKNHAVEFLASSLKILRECLQDESLLSAPAGRDLDLDFGRQVNLQMRI